MSAELKHSIKQGQPGNIIQAGLRANKIPDRLDKNDSLRRFIKWAMISYSKNTTLLGESSSKDDSSLKFQGSPPT